MSISVAVTSVLVDNQDNALAFYTEKLGFLKKADVRHGEYRWLTVVSPESPDGVEILLEPLGHPQAAPFQQALKADGVPLTSFRAISVSAEIERLRALGVQIVSEPQNYGEWAAIIDDTCGNLIQITGGE